MSYTLDANLDIENTDIEIDDEFKSKISNAIGEVLEHTHDHTIKHEIKPHSDRLQFACPYCGDSEKKPSKKRGNLYFDSLFVHCFNDGCPSPHVDFGTFLLDFGYSKQEITDRFGSYGAIKKFADENKKEGLKSFKRIRTDNSVRGDAFAELERHGIQKDDFFIRLNIQEVENNNKVLSYLKSRYQLNFKHFGYNSKGIWVLNLNSNQDKIIGAQLKTFNSSAPYITYNIQKLYQKFFKTDLKIGDQHMIDRINNLSTLFNIMHSRLTGRLTVFEGPLDSFLMNNSIALATAGRDTTNLEQLPNLRFLFDNDDTGKRRSIEKMNRGFKVFLWEKLLKDFSINTEIKDYNDLIIYCNKRNINIESKVDSYFSNNIYDKYYV